MWAVSRKMFLSLLPKNVYWTLQHLFLDNCVISIHLQSDACVLQGDSIPGPAGIPGQKVSFVFFPVNLVIWWWYK